jgi:hypothetical protein
MEISFIQIVDVFLRLFMQMLKSSIKWGSDVSFYVSSFVIQSHRIYTNYIVVNRRHAAQNSIRQLIENEIKLSRFVGRNVAQAPSRRFLTAAAGVRDRVTSNGICGEERLRRDFFEYIGFLCH